MNVAVIVAAGTGTRFGGDVPKQFVEIAGRPLIAHTVRRFEDAESIQGIVLVTSEDRIGDMQAIVDAEGFKKVLAVTVGGDSRAESVSNGVAVACEHNCQVVAIHDGARPIVTPAEIDATVAAALRDGAACLVAPVTETIKEVNFGKVVKTVDRTFLRRALTPQAFRPDILRQAMVSTDLDASVTDDSMLVEKAGFDVTTVEGSSANVKITHPEDIELAESLIKELWT